MDRSERKYSISDVFWERYVRQNFSSHTPPQSSGLKPFQIFHILWLRSSSQTENRIKTVRPVIEKNSKIYVKFMVPMHSRGNILSGVHFILLHIETTVAGSEFNYADSAIFLHPVWLEMYVSPLFLPTNVV